MSIDLKKLVRISDFDQEDKKKIIDNFDSLSSLGKLKLWRLCLENLQWKLEIEFSKRFHDGVLKGIIDGKDTIDYTQLEKEIILEIFTKGEVEARDEEIEGVRKMLKDYHKNNEGKVKPEDKSQPEHKKQIAESEKSLKENRTRVGRHHSSKQSQSSQEEAKEEGEKQITKN